MVRLAFAIDDGWVETYRERDLSRITTLELKRSVIPGDNIFWVSGVSYSLIGYQIPLLEFAHGLYIAVRAAASPIAFGETHPLDLDEHFRFRRTGDVVAIDTDLNDIVSVCTIEELEDGVRDHCINILKAFLTLHPEAKQNKALYQWFEAEALGATELFDLSPGK